jgi:hypothetical protein
MAKRRAKHHITGPQGNSSTGLPDEHRLAYLNEQFEQVRTAWEAIRAVVPTAEEIKRAEDEAAAQREQSGFIPEFPVLFGRRFSLYTMAR